MDERIPIHPLTLRGVYGVAWAALKKNFWGLAAFAIVFGIILDAAVALCLIPAIVAVAGGVAGGLGASGAAAVAGIIGSVLLVMLVSIAIALLYAPMYTGSVYNELSMRIYGETSGFSRIFKRTGFALRRYFSTALSLIVANIIVNMITSAVSGVFSAAGGFAAMSSLIPSLSSGALQYSFDIDNLDELLSLFGSMSGSTVILTSLGSFVAWAAATVCSTLLAFVYPVATNERAKHFDAIGRSVTLVWKRFGRVLGARLLLTVIAGAISTVLLVIFTLIAVALGMAESYLAMAIVIAIGLLILAAVTFFFSFYWPAVDTVLYFDTRVRLEGEGFMEGTASSAQPQPPQYQPQPAQYQQPQYQQPYQQQPAQYQQPQQSADDDPYAVHDSTPNDGDATANDANANDATANDAAANDATANDATAYDATAYDAGHDGTPDGNM